jgi:hypothetical protein
MPQTGITPQATLNTANQRQTPTIPPGILEGLKRSFLAMPSVSSEIPEERKGRQTAYATGEFLGDLIRKGMSMESPSSQRLKRSQEQYYQETTEGTTVEWVDPTTYEPVPVGTPGAIPIQRTGREGKISGVPKKPKEETEITPRIQLFIDDIEENGAAGFAEFVKDVDKKIKEGVLTEEEKNIILRYFSGEE